MANEIWIILKQFFLKNFFRLVEQHTGLELADSKHLHNCRQDRSKQGFTCLHAYVRALDLWGTREFGKHWLANSICEFAKAFWPRVERKWFIELLALSKAYIAAIIGVLTGQCLIDTHAVRLKTLEDPTCQTCYEEDVVVTYRYLLLHCPAFARLKLNDRGCHTFYGELARTDVSRLNILVFVAGFRHFVVMRRSFCRFCIFSSI